MSHHCCNVLFCTYRESEHFWSLFLLVFFLSDLRALYIPKIYIRLYNTYYFYYYTFLKITFI